jgi:fibrillarin-like rRNA methylase
MALYPEAKINNRAQRVSLEPQPTVIKDWSLKCHSVHSTKNSKELIKDNKKKLRRSSMENC